MQHNVIEGYFEKHGHSLSPKKPDYMFVKEEGKRKTLEEIKMERIGKRKKEKAIN